MKIGNRPELYKKTVDILYQAYFNDTLQHGECAACACGNIIAANNDYKIIKYNGDCYWMNKNDENVSPKWNAVFYTKHKGFWSRILERGSRYKQVVTISGYNGHVKDEIKSSGYEWHELAAIEFAFENAKGETNEDYMFFGLVNVLNVLAEIHQVQEDLESFPRFDAVYTTKRMKV